ncbi:MAG: hypothetical protein O7J95_01880 [Planctomycetota bacterium]|nr:hypothetical protein [Planctomycetota bacterium]
MESSSSATRRHEKRPLASVQFVCPSCEEEFVYSFDGSVTEARARCPSCGFEFRQGASVPPPGRLVGECFLCGNREFYVQKDFNRQLGFWIALISFLVIFLVMRWNHNVGIGLLFVLAFVDWLIYRSVGNVTVCYLCQSVYRRFPPNPEHKGFYLGSEEKYKRLRQAWLESLEKES